MLKKLINYSLFKFRNPTCIIGLCSNLHRNAKVGKHCRIGRGSSLSSEVTLGDSVIIGGEVHLKNSTVGTNSMIEDGVKVVGPLRGTIIIGEECYIGVNNVFDTSDNITIGNFVHIAGPSTALWCHSSAQMCLRGIPLNDTKRNEYRPTKPIIIESNVYIGGNCTIYPGITVGHHSIVAPNSAVTKNVPPYTMVGGVPAKKLKELQEECSS